MRRLFNDVDVNRFPYIMIPPSDTVDARVLAAGVAETHTVPAGATIVLFSGTADFYVKIGGTAAVPGADVTDGTGSILNPTMRLIGTSTTIGIISPVACVVTMEFYS